LSCQKHESTLLHDLPSTDLHLLVAAFTKIQSQILSSSNWTEHYIKYPN